MRASDYVAVRTRRAGDGVPVRLLPHHPGQVTRDSTDRVSGGRPLIWLTVLVTLFLLVYLLVALLRPEKF